MTWLVIAVGLVLLMKESIEIYDGYGQKLDYSLWDLMSFPYSVTLKFPTRATTDVSTLPTLEDAKPGNETSKFESVNVVDPPSDQAGRQVHGRPPMPDRAVQRSDTIAAYEGAYIRTCITMPSNFGLRSWRWYEAIVESLAVGIYLYATFVLTSTIFLNADKAIVYSTVMTVCLSAVRILSTLF